MTTDELKAKYGRIANDPSQLEMFKNDLIDGKVIESETQPMQEILYADLKALRDEGALVPGMQYRIIDYTCTTTQADTRSAGHVFDIIVFADSTLTLNEKARAVLHEGDTYFADCNLAAWQLWYDLDNDQTKYAWADPVNGKGVIFRMIDEFNNDIPYDFKNIQFKRFKIENDSCLIDDFNNKYFGCINTDEEVIPEGYVINDETDFVWMYTFTGTKGVWNADDEEIVWQDEISQSTELYDLSIIDMSGWYDEESTACGCIKNSICKSYDYETNRNASMLNNVIFIGCFVDISTLPENYEELYGDTIYSMMCCPHDNAIKANCINNTFGEGCSGNVFDDDCYNNIFADSCSNNTFGKNSNYNIFGISCSSNRLLGGSANLLKSSINNIFGLQCRRNVLFSSSNNVFGVGCSSNTLTAFCNGNTFGNNCVNNTLGSGCYSNNFANSCTSNTFGDNCSYNSFGNDSSFNTLGNGCSYNSFANRCKSNTFDTNCSYNSFGDYCYSNAFGKDCHSNAFGNYCYSNVFGDDCHTNAFIDRCNANTLTIHCYHNTFYNDCHDISTTQCVYTIIDNGCNFIDLTASTANAYIRNVHIHAGIHGTSDMHKAIAVPSDASDYSIDIYAPGSQEIILGGNE